VSLLAASLSGGNRTCKYTRVLRDSSSGQAAAPEAPACEDPAFLTRQLITCIGNKRALLSDIGRVVEFVRQRTGRPRLTIFEAFAGSGAVSRFLKQYAERLVVNDLEDFAVAAARCHLANRDEVDWGALDETLAWLDAEADRPAGPDGFIAELYAPADDGRIRPGERVFYTRANARRLDRYRQALDRVPAGIRDLCLGPLLSAASVHANTAGVFKGFYKDRTTGLGRFGGTGGDALGRIHGRIRTARPVLSRVNCPVEVHQGDANAVTPEVGPVDLAYFDPPYNQHPYGSNYFMLNLLVSYRRPGRISPVSGIPVDWRRSDYNVRARALPRLLDLLRATPARFLLLSFSDDGFVAQADLKAALLGLGEVQIFERSYAAFRGSRLRPSRPRRVLERLFLVDRDRPADPLVRNSGTFTSP